MNLALLDVGLPTHTEALVRTFVGNGARTLVERAAPGDTEKVLPRFRAHYDAGLIERTVAFDGMRAVLEVLRAGGVGIAVTTNKPGAPARAIVASLFPGLVDVVMGPDDAGALKPDPTMLRAVERALDGKIVALVGDSGVDRETAANAGVAFVGVAWGLRPEELGGCEIVDDAAALTRTLARILG